MQPREGPGPLGSTGFGEVPGQHYIPGGSGELETPSPGGGIFEGPGGQAPPFAPGGPENPYPPSAGMPPPNITQPPGSAAMQPGFMGSGAPGSIPGNYPVPPAGLSPTFGGTVPTHPVSSPQGQPGYNLPKQQSSQSSGGSRMTATQNPQQGPMSGVKPRGIRTVPPPEGKHPPKEPPEPPGQWVTLDAGKGQPPAYGFIQQKDESSTDTGLGDDSEKKPPKPHEQKGHYVAVQGRQDDDPIWCWVPEIGADYGVKHEQAKPLGAK